MSEGSYWAVLTAPVLESEQLSDGAKLFYGKLSRFTGKTGICWASNQTLSQELGVSEKTIQRYVRELRDAGFISTELVGVKDRKRRVERHIRLAMPVPFALPDPDKSVQVKVDKNVQVNMDKNVRAKVDKNVQVHKESNNNKNNNPPISPHGVALAFDRYAGEDRELREALGALAENRAALGKPMVTERAAALLLGKLDKLSGGNRSVKLRLLTKAVEHNWQSVYALDERELAELRQEQDRTPQRRFVGVKTVDGQEVAVYEDG